jgi:hypothetical protein
LYTLVGGVLTDQRSKNWKACRSTRNFVNVRLEVLVAGAMKSIVFWDVMLCSLGDNYQRFGRSRCLHLQTMRYDILEGHDLCV